MYWRVVHQWQNKVLQTFVQKDIGSGSVTEYIPNKEMRLVNGGWECLKNLM